MNDTDTADQQFDQGMTCADRGQYEAAAGHFQRAVEIDPGFIDAHNNLGSALVELNRHGEALASFQRAIDLDSDFAQAHFNLGSALLRLGKFGDAAAALVEAILANPNHIDAHYFLGVAQLRLGLLLDSLGNFGRTAELNPRHADAYNAIGAVLIQMGRGADAIPALDQAVLLDPGQSLARAQRMFQLARLCDWDRLAGDRPFVQQLGVAGQAVPPFTLLSFDDSPDRHRARAERYVAENFDGIAAAPIGPPPAGRPDRLRIGYFSADFHDHATMYLIAELLELHDRERFDIHLYSYGRAADDGMRQRLLRSGFAFSDISAIGDAEASDLARNHQIDIAVDLKGHTRLNRQGIFAHRAAPIQVGWLGYPGTSGATFIDYLVADRIVIPPDHRNAYSERLIILPDCYQPNDRHREISAAAPSRADKGLPENGFVFCCFNNSYKITPVEFSIWMELLGRVDGSVLWLLATNTQVRTNLRKAAQAYGIDPARLVFGERRPLPDHLARHQLADLFLDTFNCNAHTTASDALWAGLPIVTRLGDSFAARVAASLLDAVGLAELVTTSTDDYAALAYELATDPARLGAIRANLATNRETMPLFDSARFTRHLEAGYDLAYQLCLEGKPPADLAVPARPGQSRDAK